MARVPLLRDFMASMSHMVVTTPFMISSTWAEKILPSAVRMLFLGAVEEGDAKLAFQASDGAGHSGLGDVEVLGGAREASCVLDGEEVLELAEFHRLLLSCFFYYYNKYECKLLGMLLKIYEKERIRLFLYQFCITCHKSGL